MDYLRIGFLFLILGSGILFLIRKLHFSQHLAPLVTILGDTTILYIFSLLNQLQIGIVITVVLNLLLGLFSFIKFPKIGQNEKLIFSPAIILWIFIFVSLIAYTRGTLFYGWDEFTYWGVIYKYLMTTNHLPDLSSNFFITNYPPFAALFQYFVGKIIGNKESSAYFAQMLMAFSAVIAVFPKSIWSKWKKYGIAIALGVLSIFALDFTIQYLHVDLMIGLLFAAALTSVSFEDHISSDRLVSLLLISVALTLIKPYGIFFGLICSILIYIKLANNKILVRPLGSFLKSVIKPMINIQFLLAVFLPILAAITWNIHASQFNNKKVVLTVNEPSINSTDIFPWYPSDYVISLQGQDAATRESLYLFMQPQEIDISLLGILRNFSVDAPYRTKLIIQSYIENVSHIRYSASGLTVLEGILLIFIVALLIPRLVNKNDQNTKGIYWGTNAIILVGFILYGFLLLFSYIYYFLPYEATVAPSLQRYLGSYLIGWWLLIISYAYEQDSIQIPVLNIKTMDFLLGILLFVAVIKIPMSTYFHLPISPDGTRFAVNKTYKEVAEKVSTEGDKVYDIYQVGEFNDLSHYMMKYFLAPIPSNNYGWRIGEKESEEDLYTVEMTPDEWIKLLNDQKYTHVLISSVDNAFWNRYGKLFDHYDKEKVPQLFLVTPDKLVQVDLGQ